MNRFFSFLIAATMLFAASCSKSDDFDDESGKSQPANEIWYTSSDSSVVTPSFEERILSNTYESARGVIVFDSVLTSIGDWAFYGCSTLTTISIPQGVTSIEDLAFYRCSALTNIVIPISVKSIGFNAFLGLYFAEKHRNAQWSEYYSSAYVLSLHLIDKCKNFEPSDSYFRRSIRRVFFINKH